MPNEEHNAVAVDLAMARYLLALASHIVRHAHKLQRRTRTYYPGRRQMEKMSNPRLVREFYRTYSSDVKDPRRTQSLTTISDELKARHLGESAKTVGFLTGLVVLSKEEINKLEAMPEADKKSQVMRLLNNGDDNVLLRPEAVERDCWEWMDKDLAVRHGVPREEIPVSTMLSDMSAVEIEAESVQAAHFATGHSGVEAQDVAPYRSVGAAGDQPQVAEEASVEAKAVEAL